MKHIGVIIVLCMSMHMYSFFDYDRAIGWAQQNLWSDAGKLLNRLVTTEPDNPAVVYDAGVASFNNKDYQQAKAYFESAAQNDKAPKALKSQAYFNKGNAHVALQELKEALLSYEQTLMINPEDQQAQHNYGMVKQMLEQQEQEQQQNDQKQNNKQSGKDKKQDQQKDQSKQQQKNRQQQDKNQPSSDDQNGSQDEQQDDLEDSRADDEKEHEEHKDGQEEGLDQEGDQQDEQEDGLDQQQDESQEDKERDEGGDFNQKSEPNEEQQKRKENNEHESPSDKEQKEQQQQNMQGEQKEQEIDDRQEDELPEVMLDPRLERVLEKRSDRDAQLNKQMVKALVSQDMKGRHGQNCW